MALEVGTTAAEMMLLRHWLADTIDIYGWSGDECQDEDRSCRQKSWDHDDTEPADVQTVVGRRDERSESRPQGERTLLTNPNGRGIATLI